MKRMSSSPRGVDSEAETRIYSELAKRRRMSFSHRRGKLRLWPYFCVQCIYNEARAHSERRRDAAVLSHVPWIGQIAHITKTHERASSFQ